MGEDDKKVRWVGSSLEDLVAFPEDVKRRIGFDIRVLQQGGMPERGHVEPMHGFHPAVVELKMDDGGDTYRCVATVKLKHRVYILHSFKKKSTRGTETPQKDLDTIRLRLKHAQEIDADFERMEREEKRRGA